MEKVKVLFVCMGNICRSPTAEGVFTKLVHGQKLQNAFDIDSAGTHAYHQGLPPDARAQKAASARGMDLSKQRARKVIAKDFQAFDYILVMDDQNYNALLQECPEEYQAKIHFFLDFDPSKQVREVPDPYYGGQLGFEKVLDLCEAAAAGFLETVKAERQI